MSIIRASILSEGVVSGTAYVYTTPSLTFEYKKIAKNNVDNETTRIRKAVDASIAELIVLKETTQKSMGDDFAHIFRTHQTMIEDENILEEIFHYIRQNLVSAEVAVTTIFDTYKDMFSRLEDGVNKERVADFNDVCNRILRNLLHIPEASLQSLPHKSIVIAEELFPSDTTHMDTQNIVGFITEKGGSTSHVAIIARSLGIPAVFGIEQATSVIKHGSEVFLEAMQKGKTRVYTFPTDTEKTIFEEAYTTFRRYKSLLEYSKGKESITDDGHKVILSANINDDNIDEAVVHEAHSTGLFRTEFLFMKHKTLPDEEAQYLAYKKVAEYFNPGMVVIRTLDIGGDKHIPSLALPAEDNPFLGYRAIRIGLENRSILIPQIRAIMRASAHGNVKILFPMIDSIREIRELKSIIQEVKKSLLQENKAFNDDIEIGAMIEVPSLIFIINEIAREVDFVSIGTNDLTQYLLAVDRTNAKVSQYYQPFHPAVFRAIHIICNAIHKADGWVGVCGELASMKEAIPALIGMGVDELSVSTRRLPECLFMIRGTIQKRAQTLAQRILSCTLVDEVDMHLAKAYYKIYTHEKNKINTCKE